MLFLLGYLGNLLARDQLPSLAEAAATARDSSDLTSLGVDVACALIGVTVTPSEDQIPSQGTGTTTLTIQVKNGSGKLLSGAQVRLEASGPDLFSLDTDTGTPAQIGTSPLLATTGSNGTLTVSFTYPSLFSEAATLTASDMPEDAWASSYYASTATVSWERYRRTRAAQPQARRQDTT